MREGDDDDDDDDGNEKWKRKILQQNLRSTRRCNRDEFGVCVNDVIKSHGMSEPSIIDIRLSMQYRCTKVKDVEKEPMNFTRFFSPPKELLNFCVKSSPTSIRILVIILTRNSRRLSTQLWLQNCTYQKSTIQSII